MRARAEGLARLKNILNSNPVQNQDDEMSYEFSIPLRRIESVFGTAYPSAAINDGRRLHILSQLFKNDSDPTIEFRIEKYRLGSPRLNITVYGSGKKSYRKALTIEKYLWNLPRLGYVSPPRWWNRIIHRRPVDMFLIEDDMISEIINWLQENCHHRDYQFISKFKYDTTLGFRSEEAATLFKLTFGDRDFISKDAH